MAAKEKPIEHVWYNRFVSNAHPGYVAHFLFASLKAITTLRVG